MIKLPKWHIPLLLAILTILAVLMSGAQLIASTKADVKLQSKQALAELSKQNAYAVRSAVEMQLEKLEALANVIGMQESFQLDFAMQVLHAESRRTSLKRLGFAFPDGQTITTDNVQLNIGDRQHFKDALAGKPNVSEITFDKLDGETINVCAVPLYHGLSLKGVIFATSQASIFSDLIQLSLLDGKGQSYIIRPDGLPVIFSGHSDAHSMPDNLFDKSHFSQDNLDLMRRNIAQGQDGVVDYTQASTLWLAAYTKIGVSDWYLLTLAPQDALSVNSDLLVLRSVASVFATLLIMGAMLLIILLQARSSNRRLADLAFSDPLTGGNNLNRFKLLLSQNISSGHNGNLYLLRIDIDNFKLINDMYGYEEGNQVLLGMNRLLQSMLTPDEVLSRIGNDTFLCLLRAERNEEILVRDGQFRESYRQILAAQGKHYVVNFTSGLYRIPTSFTNAKPQLRDVDTLIDRTTMAHRSAKLQQSDQKLAFYSDSIRDSAIRIKNIEDSMYLAMERREFSVFLQPKYNLTTGRMEGAEALIRWIRDGKVLAPADFVPVFEKNGFIVNIDLFVLEEVCRLQRRWLDLGLRPVPVSINQSKPLVYAKDYVTKLSGTVRRFHLPPALIELELLENLIHENVGELERITEQLHKQGFLICIDDFGSGYSSLNMIKDLRADVLKVDREFLSSAESNERAEIVLRNIIELAKDLDMSVVTEGVETETQATLLRRLGCHTAQGYLFARPMPAEAYEDILRLILAKDQVPLYWG